MNLFDELAALARTHGALPEAGLRDLAARAGLPLHRLQALRSFFPHLEHPDAGRVRVCRDLSCRLAGSDGLHRAALDWAAGRGLAVESCSCLGRCDQAPAMAVEGRPAAGPEGFPPGPFDLDPHPGAPFQALRAALAAGDRDAVLASLEASGLKGMGGAGFPAGLKWRIVRAAPDPVKHVVVNADESEPGTFKDRFLLRHFPHLVLEGALLGAWVAGAGQVTLFVRHEYGEEALILEDAVRAARASGLADFCAIRVVSSPGGYICGEETALLEALAYRRAEPRNKPPFPGTAGLDGHPTLVNNVETLAWVPAILARGADWWRALNPKLVGLSGHVARPGVYQVTMGLPVREILERFGGGTAGGRALKAFSPGGASSGFLPAAMADLPYEHKALAGAGSMVGSGALVFLGEGTCMVDAALNSARFFRSESCGKCAPCRAGTAKLADFLERAALGAGLPREIGAMEDLAEAMQDASICGLGQAAPLPALSLFRHFRDELEAHLAGRPCPACAGGRA